MKMSTEEEEAAAAAAAKTDAEAMEKLLAETLPTDEPPKPPPADEPPPPPADEPPKPPPAEEPPKPPPAEQPPKPPPGEPPPPPAAAEDEFDRKLKEYELPTGATRKSSEVIKAVKNHATEEHRGRLEAETRAQTAEREAAELKQKLEAAAQEHEELERYRPIVRRLAIDQDPNFNAPYTKQLARIEGTVISNLRSWGLGEETAKYIMENGGPAHFSKDATSTVDAEREDGGKGSVRMTHKQFWQDRVLKQLSPDARDSIRIAFDDELRVRESHRAALRAAHSDTDKYFKDLEATSKKNEADFKASCLKSLEATRKEFSELVTEREIPKDATPEDRKFIETHNAAVKEASAKFDAFFLDRTPEALITKTVGGLMLRHLPKLLEAERAKTKAAWAAHDAIKSKWDAALKASNTSGRQSVLQPAKPKEGIEVDSNDGRRMEKLLEELPA